MSSRRARAAAPALNWLDRAIGWVSPLRGMRRVQARSVLGELLAYDGAKTGRRMDGWKASVGTSADREIMQFYGRMRDNAHDLVQNNPHADKGLSVLVTNRVGTGILCTPTEVGFTKRPNLRKNDRLGARLERWSDVCDITGQNDFYGLHALAERTRTEAGEALVRFIPTPMTNPLDVPFRLQVLEPDHIDTAKHERLRNGNVIRHGVEYERFAPVAYHLLGVHPGDDLPVPRMGNQSVRIPASEILHYYKTLRPGQSRGITEFASVMVRLRSLDDYDDAEVMRKKIAACLTLFIQSANPATSFGNTEEDEEEERIIEDVRPGMIAYGNVGETLTTVDPKPSTDYEPFNKVQLKAIAAGLKMPYSLISADQSEENYTSHRAGMVQFKAMIEAEQWQLVVHQLCAPICRRFTQEAAGIDTMIDPYTEWVYTPPRFGLLDPAKEVPAQILAIKAGIMSYQNTVRREGYAWRETLDEVEAFQRECGERGILLDCIPEPKQIAAGPSTDPEEDEDEDKAA